MKNTVWNLEICVGSCIHGFTVGMQIFKLLQKQFFEQISRGVAQTFNSQY